MAPAREQSRNRRTAMGASLPPRRRPVHAASRPRGDHHPMFNVPPSLAGPKRVFVACHYCGYGPSVVPPGLVCPKCGGHSWERFAISRRLLPGYRK